MGLKCNGGTTEKDIKIKEVFPLGSMNMLSKSDVILVTVLEGILWGVWMCFGNTMTVCMLSFLCHSKKGFILCESWLSVPNFKEICTAVVEIFYLAEAKCCKGSNLPTMWHQRPQASLDNKQAFNLAIHAPVTQLSFKLIILPKMSTFPNILKTSSVVKYWNL